MGKKNQKQQKQSTAMSPRSTSGSSAASAAATTTGAVAASMTTTAIAIPGRLDPAQARLAADALLTHVLRSRSGSKKTLFDGSDGFAPDAEPISLVVALRRVPERIRVKPFRISIPHDLYTEESEVCLFVKDPQRTYKDLVAEENAKVDAGAAGGAAGSSGSDSDSDSGDESESDEPRLRNTSRRIPVTQVIGLQKLRDNYKTFESKRTLSSGFDLFLADDRILPLLSKLLGNAFFEKKKQPIPVNVVKASSWAKNVRKAVYGATYMHQNPGACTMVKVGHSAMTGQQLAENIVAAAAGVAANTPKKWKGIQSLHIKTASSIALPIFSNAIVVEIERPPRGAAASAIAAAKDVTNDVQSSSAGDKKGKTGSKDAAAAKSRPGEKQAKQTAKQIATTSPSTTSKKTGRAADDSVRQKKGIKRSSSAASHDRKKERSPKNRRT